jgi:sulfate transport system ATP-binding protein
VTSFFVTHDQDEAMEVANRVVMMNHGRIEQQGSPDEVYDHPASPFVLQLLGDVNLFRGRFGPTAGPGSEADLSFVRPHELEVVAEADDETWPVRLGQILTVGPNTRLAFRRDGAEGVVDVELPRETDQRLKASLGLSPGARVHLRPRRGTRLAAPGGAGVAGVGSVARAAGSAMHPSLHDDVAR